MPLLPKPVRVVDTLPQIQPRHLGRNDACWCGSGKKFKRCHLDREEQISENPYIDTAKLSRSLSVGKCLFPTSKMEDCGRPAIASHTIQRNGGLGAIARDGKVYSVLPTFADLVKTNGKPVPKLVGWKKASTFPGFCSDHDNSLFAPIEKDQVHIERSTALLFGYRAVCYEYQRKKTVLANDQIFRDLDRGSDISSQIFIQNIVQAYAAGTDLALKDLRDLRRSYEAEIFGEKDE